MKPTVFARGQRILLPLLLCLGSIALLSSRLNAGSIFDFDDKNPPPPSKATTQSAPATPSVSRPPPIVTVIPSHPSSPDSESPAVVHPIPDAADRKKSQKLLEEVFAKELADRSPSARRGLAQHLLDEAVKSQFNPTDQFVLLIGANQAAEEAGNLMLCFHAIDELARQFNVDALHLKMESATKINLRADTAGQTAENCRTGLDLIAELTATGAFSDASRIVSRLQAMAQGNADLVAETGRQAKKLDVLLALHDKIAKDLARLQTSPDDPAANLSVGQFECFYLGAWDRGLPMLAKGSDEKLKALAADELAQQADTARLPDLGDRWWDMAEKAPDLEKTMIRQHAASLYQQSLSTVSGLRKDSMTQRISEVPVIGRDHFPAAVTNTFGIKLAYIPAGEFMMGSPADENGRSDNEAQHKVRITKSFYLGIAPVTQAQWKAVMGNNPSNFKGDDLPVEQVSWDNAVAFCNKLSWKEGKHYRLPTEAEWEYACRAGTTSPYYTGNDAAALAEAGGSHDNSDNKTHPVCQKKPNAWGLYDMHGNVWQWCNDWYDSGYYAKSPDDDPAGPAQSSVNPACRVMRGGSWNYNPRFYRSAYRFWHTPAYYYTSVGFRLALDSQ